MPWNRSCCSYQLKIFREYAQICFRKSQKISWSYLKLFGRYLRKTRGVDKKNPPATNRVNDSVCFWCCCRSNTFGGRRVVCRGWQGTVCLGASCCIWRAASCLLQRAAFNLLMATCCFRRAAFYIIRAARRLRRAATLSEGGIMLSEGGEEGILPQRAAGYSQGRHDEFRGQYLSCILKATWCLWRAAFYILMEF